jgi:3-hydroxybutyryl-CoA dehydrogenase
MNQSENIAVIGAGLMGHGIAQIFLAAGHEVSLHDLDADTLADAPNKIREIFTLFELPADQLDNLSLHDSLAGAAEEADFVIEAGPEKLEIKQSIFYELTKVTKPTAILATNTSAIPIRDIGMHLDDAGRVVGTHFWNPPHLVRLVEVVQSDRTDLSAVANTIELLERSNMKPVHVRRDIPGHIGNRLQHAMKREAIAMIAEGVCDAETIDEVVKSGFGSRLATLGPMEQSDLVGLNLTLDIYKTLFATLDNTSEAPQLLVDKVSRGDLGMKTGKGFREWTPESAEKVRRDLQDFLLQQAKLNLKK